MKIGFSLNTAINNFSNAELEDFLDNQLCYYCGCNSLDFRNFIDVKGLLDDVVYHIHELTFECGHTNLVFVQTNDCILLESRCLTLAEFENFIAGAEKEIRECWHLKVLLFYRAMAKQDLDTASKISEGLRANFPKDPYSYIWSANVALKQLDFERYEELYEIASHLEPVLHQLELSDVILEEKEFVLGKIFVAQDMKQRRLFINQQNQGGLLLDSSKSDTSNLSTVPESFCSVIFYPAAKLFPDGKLLMLGLGSGAGIIALMTEFSELSITVVEKFQGVIDLALKHFHYLSEFVQQGRLEIVCNDGLSYITEISNRSQQAPFDAVCIDMYSGEQGYSFSLEASNLSAIACVGKTVWMNYIGKCKSNEFLQLLEAFKSVNVNFQYMSSVFENFECIENISNLLLSTDDFDRDLVLKIGPKNLLLEINSNLECLAMNKISIFS
jgi:hypothetical protein